MGRNRKRVLRLRPGASSTPSFVPLRPMVHRNNVRERADGADRHPGRSRHASRVVSRRTRCQASRGTFESAASGAARPASTPPRWPRGEAGHGGAERTTAIGALAYYVSHAKPGALRADGTSRFGIMARGWRLEICRAVPASSRKEQAREEDGHCRGAPLDALSAWMHGTTFSKNSCSSSGLTATRRRTRAARPTRATCRSFFSIHPPPRRSRFPGTKVKPAHLRSAGAPRIHGAACTSAGLFGAASGRRAKALPRPEDVLSATCAARGLVDDDPRLARADAEGATFRMPRAPVRRRDDAGWSGSPSGPAIRSADANPGDSRDVLNASGPPA